MFGKCLGSVMELTGVWSPFDRGLVGVWSSPAGQTPINHRSISDLPIETYITYSEQSLLKLKNSVKSWIGRDWFHILILISQYELKEGKDAYHLLKNTSNLS
jgi:hypothetical protein